MNVDGDAIPARADSIDFPECKPPAGVARAKAIRVVPVIREDEAKRLRELGPAARKTTGSSPLDSPIRASSEQFSALVIELKQRGVTWNQIAEATESHTASGLRMRAARHGAQHGGTWSVPPSTTPYRRIDVHTPEFQARVTKVGTGATENFS